MTPFELYQLSSNLQASGSLFLIIIASLTLRFNKSIEVKLILIYATGSVLFQLGQDIFSKNSNNIGDYFVLFEATLFLILYYFLIPKSFSRKLILLSLISFYLYFLVYKINATDMMGSSIRTFRDVLMILFSIIYFVQLMKDLPEERLSNIPMFWINSSILFFFSCTFILSLTMSYIAAVLKEDFSPYWAFRNFLRLGFCMVIGYGIWKARVSQNKQSL